MKLLRSCIIVIFGVILLVCSALSGVPHLINYQATLMDADGKWVEGEHDLIFSIYADSLAETALWTETHEGLDVGWGGFSVILGSLTAITDDLFNNHERWMGITVDTDAEMTPRMRITAAPWALRAAIADSALAVGDAAPHSHHSLDAADGAPLNAVFVDDVGNVGVGTDTPVGRLDVYSAFMASGTHFNFLTGPNGSNDADLFKIATGRGYGFPGALLRVDNGESNLFYIRGDGNISIGGASPVSKFTIACDSNTELDFVGGQANIRSSDSLTILAGADGPLGLGSGNIHNRVYIASDGDVGIGTTAPQAQLDVVGDGNAENVFSAVYAGGPTYAHVIGVKGEANPTDGHGVGGSFTGGYCGVEGIVAPTGSDSYIAVRGFADGGDGNNYNYGVEGIASGPGTNYGIYGEAPTSVGDYAGYFFGNVLVNGGLMVEAKPAPPTPSGGFVIYVDSSDMKLKAKSAAGTVTILANF